MNNKYNISKYKYETLALAEKKRRLIIIGLILIGASLISFIFGFVTLAAAIDGQFHYTAADILLILATTFLVAGIVMLIIRKAVFDKKLKEREVIIKKIIAERKKNKVHHDN